MPDQIRPEFILIGIILLIVVGRRLLLLKGEKEVGAVEGQTGYGLAGAAVCPRCGRAFARHFLSPNLVTGKLSRCPHCARWSIVPRATPAELAVAEAAHRVTPEASAPNLSEEERLRRQIEASKYE